MLKVACDCFCRRGNFQNESKLLPRTRFPRAALICLSQHTLGNPDNTKIDTLLTMSTSTAPPTTTLANDPFEPSKQEASRLLDLPPELRNHVYSYLLQSEKSIRFYDGCRVSTSGFCHPPILATCRFVHKEAVPILYGGNKFEVSGKWPDSAFTERLYAFIPLLRHVEISSSPYDCLPEVIECLEPAVGLETLEVECLNDWDDEETAFIGDEEYWAEQNAIPLFGWVYAQRIGRSFKKKDPLEVLRISYSQGGCQSFHRLTVEKLAWKLEHGRRYSRGYQDEYERADESRNLELNRVKERAEKLELKLRGLVEEK